MERKNFELEGSTVDMDARTFEGYASTWSEDLVGDIIQMGAFSKSINESFPAGRIKVLWQHAQPIGMPVEMREDAKGLWVKGRVSKTALGDEALELMRDGVVDRMSIGFTIPNGKSETRADGVRIIREARLMEFSPVTFPANPEAAITGVKHLSDLLKSERFSDSEKQELLALASNLEALVKQQPPVGTVVLPKPPELEAILASFKNFGASLGVTK